MNDLDSQKDLYERIGFSTRIGFGQNPAVLVIDMCRGITEPGHPLSIDMDRSFQPMNAILSKARGKGVPVVYTTVAYTEPHLADGGTFVKKIPHVGALVEGSYLTEIDPRCAPHPGDVLIVKKFPSGFYATNMQTLLSFMRIDTTIIVGNSTSGCVRATVVDACSGGFRVILPKECIADRAPLSHAVGLFDMDSKYGDVVASSAVLEYLDGIEAGALRGAAVGAGA